MRKKEPLRGQKAVSSSEFSSSQCLFTCWGGVSFLNHHSPPARAPLCYVPCASSSGRVPGANISPRRDALCFGGTSRSPSPGKPAGWHLPPPTPEVLSASTSTPAARDQLLGTPGGCEGPPGSGLPQPRASFSSQEPEAARPGPLTRGRAGPGRAASPHLSGAGGGRAAARGRQGPPVWRCCRPRGGPAVAAGSPRGLPGGAGAVRGCAAGRRGPSSAAGASGPPGRQRRRAGPAPGSGQEGR